jgi:hypothetical protein
MNPQQNPNPDRNHQELKTQLGPTWMGRSLQQFVNHLRSEAVLERTTKWFNSLPSSGQVTVAIIAALAGFSLLSSVLQLIASLVSFTLLGGILYLVYQFFVTSQSSK